MPRELATIDHDDRRGRQTRWTTTLPHVEVTVRPRFEDLYLASFPGLIGVATALTGDPEHAQDLVQETMVKTFVRWQEVSRLDMPAAWCHRVLTNACHSWWRRRNTERRYLAGLRPQMAVTAGPTPDVVAFWAAANALPTRPRLVVVLHFAGDHTMAEVATILGVPEGTVRSDIARARPFMLAAIDGVL